MKHKSIEKLISSIEDERSMELFNKHEWVLSIAEKMKLKEYIKDYNNPLWKPVIIDGVDSGYKN